MLAVYLSYFMIQVGIASLAILIFGSNKWSFMFGIAFWLFLFLSVDIGRAEEVNSTVEPKYKIAIVDTGYNPALVKTQLKLCANGHYDMTKDLPGIGYYSDHGSVIASIIADKLKDVDYCAIVYSISYSNPTDFMYKVWDALERIKSENVTVVNLSLSGRVPSQRERRLLQSLSNGGTVLFVAAGNDQENLDITCDVYPACYKINNLYSVGALDGDKYARISNYGKRVKLWFSGKAEPHFDQQTVCTSYATPRALAEFVSKLSQKENSK